MRGHSGEPRGKSLVIQSARHRPFEIAILTAATLTGVFSFFTPKSPSILAMEASIPYYGYVWSIGLILGGGLGLASLLMKIPSTLLVERISMSLLSTLFLAYAFSAVFILGISLGSVGGLLNLLAFGGGALARAFQISRDLKNIQGVVDYIDTRDRKQDKE